MYIFAPGLGIAKKTKIVMFISFLSALINVILNFILIPIYGLEGAAFATLISAFLVFVIRLYASNQHYKIPYVFDKLVISFLISLVVAYILHIGLVEISIINSIIKVIMLVGTTYIVSYLLVGKNNINIVFKKLRIIK